MDLADFQMGPYSPATPTTQLSASFKVTVHLWSDHWRPGNGCDHFLGAPFGRPGSYAVVWQSGLGVEAYIRPSVWLFTKEKPRGTECRGALCFT